MKILIYGAGGLGSLCAARLQQAGQEVALLARGRRLDDLREHGIVLENGLTGERSTVRVPLVDCLYPEEHYDFGLVIMGRHQVPAILPFLAANHQIPTYVFMGNNAAGAGEYIRAVGRERVLLGFVGASAYRVGNIVRYGEEEPGETGKVFAGELDGHFSARLACLVNIFEKTGLPLEAVPDMDAWLKYHAALILPLVCAVFAAQSDLPRLARTRDAQVLVVRAFREISKALKTAGFQPSPAGMRLYEWIPEPLLVGFLRKLLTSAKAEITFSHAENTRPEMCLVTEQLEGIIRSTGIRTPYFDFVKAYLDPLQPPLADGSTRLDLNWQEVALPLAGLAGLALLLRAINKKK